MAKMTNQERVRRLRLLRDRLRLVKGNGYDHRTWGGESVAGDSHCRTPACALGYACRMPVFQRLGLRSGYVPGTGFLPVYRGENGIGAGQKLFGVSEA